MWPRRGAPLVAALVGVAGAVIIAGLYPGALVASLAVVPVGAAVTAGGAWLVRRIPSEIETWGRRRRILAALWLLVALIGVVQVGRLSTYMTDHDFDWFLSTRHPFFAKHECANAYFYAAELNLRGEPNVYDAVHYPGLNREAQTETALVGMAPEDPYQYAPQFLLWPTLAISLTHDYPAIRMTWYGLQVALLMGTVLGLALWVGGRAGRLAALWSPAMLVAFPVMYNLQYGQFHFAAVALGVLGLLAFERGRSPLGGALLAVSILSKLFPAVLLVLLAAQRRWRDLAWTAVAGVVLTAVGLAVLGPAPFVAFFDYHLPRLASGDAFAFGEAWPEVRELIITSNQGAFGLVTKLEEMGLPGASVRSAMWANRLFSLALLGAAVLVGLSYRRLSRYDRATSWVALLGLGSLMSTGAFADYVPLTCVWLLTLLVVKIADRPKLAPALGLCAVLQFFILGTVPLGEWTPVALMLPVSALGALAMMATFGWSLADALRGATVVDGTGATWSPPVRRPRRAALEPALLPVGSNRVFSPTSRSTEKSLHSRT